MNQVPTLNTFQFWARYIDDVLCVAWPQLGAPARINAFDPAIELTMEEGGDLINYLDLQLICPESHNILKISFSVHRKDTYTRVSINAASLHPDIHKTAIITSTIHRMLQLPQDASSIETQTITIKRIAHINGLQLNIDLMIRRRRLRNILSAHNPAPAQSPS